MSLDTLDALTNEAVETTSTWNAMISDREKCARKIEQLRAGMMVASSMEDTATAMNMITMLSYMITQYEMQLNRFPARLASLRQRYMMLPLSPEEIRRARPKGLN